MGDNRFVSTPENPVEGDWGNFTIRIVNHTDHAEVDKLLKYLRATYYRDEPCYIYLGFSEEAAEDLDLMVKSALPHNLSLIAIEKETQTIAGARIVVDGRQKLDFSKLPEIRSAPVRKIFKYKNILLQRAADSPSNLWKEFLDAGDNFASPFVASVDPKYRGIGLASEMSSRSLNLIRSRGYSFIRSGFNNPITRKIALKLGYEELSKVYFHELVGFDDGNPATLDWGGKTEPGAFANLMALKL